MEQRFSTAQVGDTVYCRINGFGTVSRHLGGSVLVCFENSCQGFPGSKTVHSVRFSLDGRINKGDFEATLFYRNDSKKYLTRRPKTAPVALCTCVR